MQHAKNMNVRLNRKSAHQILILPLVLRAVWSGTVWMCPSGIGRGYHVYGGQDRWYITHLVGSCHIVSGCRGYSRPNLQLCMKLCDVSLQFHDHLSLLMDFVLQVLLHDDKTKMALCITVSFTLVCLAICLYGLFVTICVFKFMVC